MSDPLSHEDISARFQESAAVDFEAVGQFMAKLGPELVIRDQGLHGVVFGRWVMLGCFMPVDDLRTVFGGLRGAGGLAQAVDLPKGQ